MSMTPEMKRIADEQMDRLSGADSSSASPTCYGVWQPISTLKCGGDAVLLYAEVWKDPDFNPSGIREGFRNDDDEGPIYSARWNDCYECWETDVNREPTHWMPRPAAP